MSDSVKSTSMQKRTFVKMLCSTQPFNRINRFRVIRTRKKEKDEVNAENVSQV